MNTNFIKYLKLKWHNSHRKVFFKEKPSTRNLIRLCSENKTNEYTLVVHSEDVDFLPYFPNSFTVTKRKDVSADLHVDLFYTQIAEIKDASFNCILCTGLLEHLPEPQLLIDNLFRILIPGGKLIISASSVFSIHEGPNDFYHFTHYSFRNYFNTWSKIIYISGSSQPFETIGILINRIILQCDIFPPVRFFIEIISKIIPVLDIFISHQYSSVGYKSNSNLIDSMLPSNIQAVVIK